METKERVVREVKREVVSPEFLNDLMSQFTEEVGEDDLSGKTLMLLRQKFGLSAVELIQSDKHLLRKYGEL